MKNKIIDTKIKINKLKDDLVKLEKENFLKSKEYKDAQSKVGKFFKYKNCYSCAEKPEDYWFLYSYVKKVNLDCCNHSINYPVFEVERFQIDKYEDINIKSEKLCYGDSLGEEVKDLNEIKEVLRRIRVPVDYYELIIKNFKSLKERNFIKDYESSIK